MLGSKNRRARLVATGGVAALMALAGFAGPASASSSGWESIIGGHITSAAQANRIAAITSKYFAKVHVQKITSTNYEVEIFNGGRTQADALKVCAKAKTVKSLPHCSVEQEFHGNGWGK